MFTIKQKRTKEQLERSKSVTQSSLTFKDNLYFKHTLRLLREKRVNLKLHYWKKNHYRTAAIKIYVGLPKYTKTLIIGNFSIYRKGATLLSLPAQGHVKNSDFGYSYGQISASTSVEEQADARDLAKAVAKVAVSDSVQLLWFEFQKKTRWLLCDNTMHSTMKKQNLKQCKR